MVGGDLHDFHGAMLGSQLGLDFLGRGDGKNEALRAGIDSSAQGFHLEQLLHSFDAACVFEADEIEIGQGVDEGHDIGTGRRQGDAKTVLNRQRKPVEIGMFLTAAENTAE